MISEQHRFFFYRVRSLAAKWMIMLLFVASLPLYPDNASAAGDEVSVTLGASPVQQGISPRAGDDPDGLRTGTVAGATYWLTNKQAPSPGTSYFYMNVDDAFLNHNTDSDVWVTVEYFDKGNGSIVLQYDADSAPFKDAPLFTYTDTNQWKTYTFKLADAKFANRTNGADFRIGVDGGGAPPNTPDLYVASVKVTKKQRLIIPSDARVIQTQYPTADVVIANYNVADFGARADDGADDTPAFRDALEAARHDGGGVVFVPSGRYTLRGDLTVPTGVTLRGDWINPESAPGVAGTVLEVYADQGAENAPSFLKLEQSSGVTNLSIWYPEQSVSNVTPYPWTIEQLTGDNATVQNVTLVNAYKGIKIGPAWNELHYVKELYGTTLHTGIFLDYTTDIGRLEGVHLSPAYWAKSGLAGAPGEAALTAYMTAHAEGIVMGRSDWEYMSGIHISGYQTGMRITTRTGSLETANAQLYDIHIDNSHVALKIEGVNNYGLLITDSSFKADTGEAPVAIYATQGFNSIVQFNTVTVGGNPKNAVVNEGTGVLSFENSVFENWNYAGGGYAIASDSGSLILGQTQFAKPDHHVLLNRDVLKVNAVNSGYQGSLDLTDHSESADINSHQDEQYRMKTLPANVAVDRAVRPRPASARLFDVTKAPYLADRKGTTDAAAAVRQALTDAAAQGGTVYMPAGIYRINSPITVPSGVELRGSWDVPHHTIGGGSVIFTNHGENNSNGTPLITLEANAGINGLSVYYDQQVYNQIKPYAWTIQGKGHNVYLINTTLVNSYQGVDFGTYDTSGHYIDYVAGSPLKEGIYLGGGAQGGIMRNVQFNPHYYARSTYPNGIPGGGGWEAVWNYQKENLDAFRIGAVKNQTIFNTFVFGSQYGIHFVTEHGQGPEAIVIGHGTDGSKKGACLEGAGEQGLTFINTELVSMSTSDKVYITLAESFKGEATFFNTSMWGGTTRSVDLLSGKLHLQQANFTVVGERGIQALGGELWLYDSYFQQAGTTHIYAGPEIVHIVEAANLFNGDLQLENHAPGKVTGTDIKPLKLKVSASGYDPVHPERLGSVVTLSNLAFAQGAAGKIELVQPADDAGRLVPIRFEGLALGAELSVKLPLIASDTAAFKITLDSGQTYTLKAQVGKSVAAHESDDRRLEAPSIRLSRPDQYFSTGGKWKGESDLSADARVTWTDQALHLNVKVQDDVHDQRYANGDIWQGDSLQLGLDLSRKDGAASQNVNELGFALGNDGSVTKWRWRAPAGRVTGAFDAQAQITRSNGVTTYDLTIPFAQLRGPSSTFQPGDPIGLALLINENDGAGRTGFMEYNQGIGTSKDATSYGDLYLLGKNYADVVEQAAELAVREALEEPNRNMTRLDAARAFVAQLPDGEVKTRLLAQLNPPAAPVITYSDVVPATNSVTATLSATPPVTITNNGGSNSYTFYFNGSFTFEYVDALGRKGTATAAVNNLTSASKAKPGAPMLSDNNGHDTGLADGDYTIAMNMWYGDNGRIYRLYENDKLIDTQILTDRSPGAQQATTSFHGKKNGTYRYYAELVNAFGTTRSAAHTVTVTQASPSVPALSHDNWDGDGNFQVSMNLWWGTNGTTYRLYENGVLIDTQALTSRTPSAQSAVTAITGKSVGTYEYRAELVNEAGSASSSIMKVRVTK
ncbi:glycosyl hydrolase family 28-related protein [Paenibacillus filicis]|uniref:Glycosyl hydrolase family 28-related protein n=1 Tax=Paenibacillus filicis TaxID=669464 RepID=A0ABU9DQH5_9BACL